MGKLHRKRHSIDWGRISGPLAIDSVGKLDILGHNGDMLGMDGKKVGVLKKSTEVGLSDPSEGTSKGFGSEGVI